MKIYREPKLGILVREGMTDEWEIRNHDFGKTYSVALSLAHEMKTWWNALVSPAPHYMGREYLWRRYP